MHLRAVHGKIYSEETTLKKEGGRIECAGHVIRQKQQIRRMGGDNLLNFAGASCTSIGKNGCMGVKRYC